jgi:hypothetical protein
MRSAAITRTGVSPQVEPSNNTSSMKGITKRGITLQTSIFFFGDFYENSRLFAITLWWTHAELRAAVVQ